MRALISITLFTAIAALVAASPGVPNVVLAQEKEAKQKLDQPRSDEPDEATLQSISEKTGELRKAIGALRGKIADEILVEVEIHLKAAETIVRLKEWHGKDSGKWALTALDQGLARVKQAGAGKAPWRDAPGKWVVRAYRSTVDGSIQPYAVLLPHEYGLDPKKRWRLDLVLHGRDASLTEAKFIAGHRGDAPKGLGYIQLEVFGRGNNAYRWAGEADVFEARDNFMRSSGIVDRDRVVLRGFSMGGAGTWHIGLHFPSEYCAIAPGAGFTTTRGYVGTLPKQLPEYVEKGLHIYDAVDYAENAFDVPIVAYSGEKDSQKQAADNIEAALKMFKEPVRFTHLVAPGLAHQMPKLWQEKSEAELKKYADKGRGRADRIRFVTYTPRYGTCDWLTIRALEETYSRAVCDVHYANRTFHVTTSNVRRFDLRDHPAAAEVNQITVDGVPLKCLRTADQTAFEKRGGSWTAIPLAAVVAPMSYTPDKRAGLQGPIDDAFSTPFRVILPTGEGFAPTTDRYAAAAAAQFAAVWDRYFRAALPVAKYKLPPSTARIDAEPIIEFQLPGFGAITNQPLPDSSGPARPAPIPTPRTNLILFGDPRSNPAIGKIAERLPITWTPNKLVVNGVEYDVRTHVPVLIYPNPQNRQTYVVINSGHTFKEADLKGTNALLYPRLGDWAIIKPTPTEKDPAAYELVAAGLFDENWQFPKKK